MAKTAAKSSNTDVLRVEKRVVDLELSLNELKESIQNIDVSAVPEMKQKLDDVEDLIMVEQAAVLELKKMLEQPSVPENLEQRLSTLESTVPNLAEKTELETKIENIEKDLTEKVPQVTSVEMENLHNKITEVETTLAALRTKMESISKDHGEKINDLSLKTSEVRGPPIDYELLASKIDAGKDGLDELSRSKLNLEMKIAELTKKLEILEKNIGKSPEQVLFDGLKLNRKEIISTNARIDSLERVARELMADAQNFEKSFRRLESLEKISFLGRDIEEKMEKVKFIEDDVKRLTTRTQGVYDEIDRRLEKIGDIEKKYVKSFSEIKESVESDKRQIETIKKNQNEQLIKTIKNMTDSRFSEIENILNNLNKNKMENLINKMEKLENIGGLDSIDKKIDGIRKGVYPIVYEGLKPLSKKVDWMEKKMRHANVDEINKILTDVTTKISYIENRLNNVDKIAENKMKDFSEAVKEKISEIREPIVMDDQIKEVVDRIIYLESRIRGIEGMMENMAQDRSRIQPIIIE